MTTGHAASQFPRRPIARPLLSVLLILGPALAAQAQFGPPPAGPRPPPREAAPIDLTGYWVAIVNEDWRWRMVTPPKGDYSSITMLNPLGRSVADAWDPSEDGSCKAYGAAALLRMPTRLHIEWAGDDVLALETDAGEQTRALRFASEAASAPAASPGSGPPSRQGYSTAEWLFPARPPGGLGFGFGGPRPPGGSLEVTTTNLLPGWLRRNGVPYSGETTVTEYFDRFAVPTGDEWLVVTTIVEDPTYLSDHFVTSSHFRREPDGSKWNPKPCRED